MITLCGIGQVAAAQAQVAEPAPGSTERIRLDAEITSYLSRIEGNDALTRIQAFNGLLEIRIPPSMGVPVFSKLVERFAHGDHNWLRPAAFGLGRYGKEARSAVPMLIALAEDPRLDAKTEQGARNGRDILLALYQIDPEHPRLLPLLMARAEVAARDGEVPLIDTTAKMGARARDALPTLERIMQIGTVQAALHAYVARGRILGLSEPAVAELKKNLVLDWKSADGGYAVLSALEKNAEDSSFAVPVLIANLRNQETPRYAQAKIVEILGQIEPATPQIIAELFDRLTDNDEFYQRLVGGALWLQVQAGKKALVPATAEGLHHRSSLVKLRAAELLLSGPISSKAVPAIVECLEETARQDKLDWRLVSTLLTDVRRLKANGTPAVEAIVKFLPDESLTRHHVDGEHRSWRRAQIFLTLADVGGSPRAMPHIQEALQVKLKGPVDRHLACYAAAARAAGALGPAGKDAVPGLLRSLKDDFPDNIFTPDELQSSFYVLPRNPTSAGIEAIIALGRIGPDARAALPLLQKLTVAKVPPQLIQRLVSEKQMAIKAIEGR
jgi:hypothetical protein